jgi:hypothetical protein
MNRGAYPRNSFLLHLADASYRSVLIKLTDASYRSVLIKQSKINSKGAYELAGNPALRAGNSWVQELKVLFGKGGTCIYIAGNTD